MSYLESCPIGCRNALLLTTSLLRPEGQLKQCNDCGQLLSQCTENYYQQTMEMFNAPEGTLADNRSRDRAIKLHTDRLILLSKVLKKPPQVIKLLDVGCSSGGFLNSAKSLGFQTHGIEPAAKAAQTAIDSGHEVKIGVLDENTYPAGSFDAVSLIEVIEHLKEPGKLLQDIHRVLKPNGILMISTGNADSFTVKYLREQWDYFSMQENGGHISFFNPQSMSRLAQQQGFVVEKLITRNLKLANKGQVSKVRYRVLKVFSELLSPFVRFFGKGHDMLVLLRKVELS